MIPLPDPRDLDRHVDELGGRLTETAAIDCTLPDGTPILVRFLDAGGFVVACPEDLHEVARQHVARTCRLSDVTLTALFEDAASEARRQRRSTAAEAPPPALSDSVVDDIRARRRRRLGL